jgi:hypothetical protein
MMPGFGAGTLTCGNIRFVIAGELRKQDHEKTTSHYQPNPKSHFTFSLPFKSLKAEAGFRFQFLRLFYRSIWRWPYRRGPGRD